MLIVVVKGVKLKMVAIGNLVLCLFLNKAVMNSRQRWLSDDVISGVCLTTETEGKAARQKGREVKRKKPAQRNPSKNLLRKSREAQNKLKRKWPRSLFGSSGTEEIEKKRKERNRTKKEKRKGKKFLRLI